MSLDTRAIQRELLRFPGVFAVKVEPNQIKVFVKRLRPEDADILDRIPKSFAGLPVVIVESGNIPGAFSAQILQQTGRLRPTPGGVSIGYWGDVKPTGTLGTRVFDKDGNKLILSNTHIFAPHWSAPVTIGDPIIQPGSLDGGNHPLDTLATLLRYSIIDFGGVRDNLLDAAIASPINPADVLDEVLQIGPVTDIAAPVEGMPIKMVGRTSGLKLGFITDLNVEVLVTYDVDIAIFSKQGLATRMARPGDSGSLLVDATNRAVGLVFAGSDQVTVFTPITTVLSLLNIHFGTPLLPAQGRILSIDITQ